MMGFVKNLSDFQTESIENIEALTKKWKKLITKAKLLDIRGNLCYMMCYYSKKMEESEVISETNRKEWEQSWGYNNLTGGINNRDFIKLAEDKLRSMKLCNPNEENVNYGENFRGRSRQKYVPYSNDRNRWRKKEGK